MSQPPQTEAARPMKHRIPSILALLGAFLLAAIAVPSFGPAAAQGQADARIEGVEVKAEGSQLLVGFRLTGGFGEELQKRIDSGLPTSLVYELELLRSRRSFFDKAVAGGELRVIAMYNALTREYLVNFKHDGNLIGSKVLRDPAELRQAMTEIAGLPAFPMGQRSRDERFQLRVRAELGTGTVFFFIPHTLRTDWAETAAFRLRDLQK
jgi:hypothetical protein